MSDLRDRERERALLSDPSLAEAVGRDLCRRGEHDHISGTVHAMSFWEAVRCIRCKVWEVRPLPRHPRPLGSSSALFPASVFATPYASTEVRHEGGRSSWAMWCVACAALTVRWSDTGSRPAMTACGTCAGPIQFA